ncbi:KAT8 regulatory NSL complex subunit 1 isoform X2 [Octopus bimaculoides]|uniref:KAT8 regulatory NSL complex subunit 1 isoform X2 n=1 Tax=Octopus bimaculoides TaxID=37653 RepID=UPI0022E741AE|nr:KAT8 regulatory NSL complex subunit 1 isoform X2 [Octopus bimaculoides]XP_052823325.1 KAT8 regulatory NSL complex subunit 1 isoform X2 [Octopus bimaculoides]
MELLMLNDGMYPLDNHHRRSEWKWAAERSAIASRWTWLQAQVSDLEYRIRQQSDTHRQIRSEKGDLIFESLQTQPVTYNSRTGEILNQEEKSGEKRTEKSNKPFVFQSSKFNQSLVNCILPLGLTSPMSSGKDTCQSSTQKSLNGLIDSNHNGKSVSTSDVASPTVKTDDKLLLENSESLATPTVPVDVTCQAARCRPVKSYRKRKLFRTAGLHQLYRKATRLSTVKCHCYTPVIPCAMCGGRYNNTQTLDPDLMPLHERLSLLDPSFHPVLSFSQEIPLPVHFEALLKSGEWQNKPSPKPTKSTNERRRQKLLQNEARRTSKKLKNAAAVLLSSAKFRSRYDKKPVQKSRPPSTSPVSLTMTTSSATSSSLPTTPQNKVTDKRLCRTEIKKRRAAQLAIALKKLPSRSLSLGSGRLGKRRFRMTSESSGLKDASSAMNFPSYTFKEMKEATLRKRRGESAFDINNIVIPYSMAASTRVEKLQYKEIVTPKWREIGEDSSESKTETEGINSSVKSPCTTIKEAISGKTNGIIVPAHIKNESDDETETNDAEDDELPIEDLSDELYIQRHAKCEIQEKKRFVSYFQHGRRSNRSVRLDDSDPISPESVSLMDSNSMVGSPTHSLTSSRHGNESLHSVASQFPPLPPLLQLQVQSPSQSVTNPNIHKHPSMQSVTESKSFFASIDDASDELKQLENQQNVFDKSSLLREEVGDVNNKHQQSLLTSCQSASGSKKQSFEQTLLKSEGAEHSHQMLAGYKLSPASSTFHHSSKLTPPQAFSLDSCLQTRPSTPTTYSAGQLLRCNDEQIGRRRSSSVSRTDRFSYDDENMTISHEMFEHLCVEPWVPRTFPLSEEDVEKLHVGNSSVEVQKNPSTTSPEISQAELATPGSSHPCSPLPSSSSASTTEDDPNDPEWKVIGSKSGIVLRLAKR